jgi:hypothetical protein
MFPNKAAQIRLLASEGYSVKDIAARVGTSQKYVYSVRGRDCYARTTHGRLDQILREIGLLRADFGEFRDELRERFGMPGVIERRLKAIPQRSGLAYNRSEVVDSPPRVPLE